MSLKTDEHVVAAWAERHSGPGWSNTTIEVLIRKNGTSDYRMESIQPHDQTPEMLTLFGVSCAAIGALTAVVRETWRPHGPG